MGLEERLRLLEEELDVLRGELAEAQERMTGLETELAWQERERARRERPGPAPLPLPRARLWVTVVARVGRA